MNTLDQELLGQVRGDSAVEEELPVHYRVDEWVANLTAQIEAELDQLRAERRDAQKRTQEIDTEINRLKRILRASGQTIYKKRPKKANTAETGDTAETGKPVYSASPKRKKEVLNAMRGKGFLRTRDIAALLPNIPKSSVSGAVLALRQDGLVRDAGFDSDEEPTRYALYPEGNDDE